MDRRSGFDSAIRERLASILALHFDPAHGAPYWIEKAAELPFDPRTEIHAIADLPRFGLMDQRALRNRPLSDFIPRAIRSARRDLVIVQTGGTLGEPVWTAYTPEEYDAAFVAPFVAAAEHVGFPAGGTWLYVGPTGPHVIGRAARSIALATGAGEPFMVDFDSRWAKKLPADSFASERYLDHVVEQAMAIIRVQPISHLFTTPPVLSALAIRMSPAEREAIRAIHYGGVSLAAEVLAHFQTTVFPAAIHLSGYGNTLFGCCLELDITVGRTTAYFPHGTRLVFGSIAENASPDTIDYSPNDRRDGIVFSRLDETMLLLNVRERDVGAVVRPPDKAPASFALVGVMNPAPPPDAAQPIVSSLY